MLTSLKVGYVVCWVVALLINYANLPSGLITSIGFLLLLVYFSFEFSIRVSLSSRLLYLLIAMLTIFSTIIFFSPNFDPFQLAWYLVLYILLVVGNGHLFIFRPKLTRLPVSRFGYLDIVCILLLVASLYSSWDMFAREGEGIINPNVASALCGYLLMVYALENKLCNLLHLARRAQISHVMIIVVALVGIMQFSRAIAFWLMAAYFLSKTFHVKDQSGAGRFVLIVCFILLIASLGVFFIPQNSDVEAMNEVIRNAPGALRLKGEGMESDVVRLVEYPVLLSSFFLSSIDKFAGLGIGIRPYRELLPPGMDLHSAYLVIASDGGLLLLGAVLFFIIHRGRDTPYQGIVRLLVFATAAMYGGLLVGLAPFTLSISMLLVAMRNLSNIDVEINRLMIRSRQFEQRSFS